MLIDLIGSSQIEAALAFYKALKVYPQPGDLISIYDKTVDKVREPPPSLAFAARHPDCFARSASSTSWPR